MTILSSVAFGVFSGIITSLIIWIIASVTKNTLIPWYQTCIYRGVNIEDNWEGKSTAGSMNYEYQLSIKNQMGHLIDGVLFIKNTHAPTGDTNTSNYNFEGTITDGFLSISYSSASNKTIGLGNLLLKITNKGNSLQGAMVYMETRTAIIETDNNIKLDRKNS